MAEEERKFVSSRVAAILKVFPTLPMYTRSIYVYISCPLFFELFLFSHVFTTFLALLLSRLLYFSFHWLFVNRYLLLAMCVKLSSCCRERVLFLSLSLSFSQIFTFYLYSIFHRGCSIWCDVRNEEVDLAFFDVYVASTIFQ